MNCAQCKWFNTVELIEDHNEHQVTLGMGRCEITQSKNKHPVHAQTLAYADDAEDYSAVLVVSPNFGCIQFEQADTTDPAGETA